MTNEICTSAERVARVAVSLRKHFVAHPGYDTTLRLFHGLMDKRRAELDLGLTSEGRGIAVIGESGSGKTTAAQRILRRMDLSGTEPGELRWISIRVPTPATQKDLARAILQALDFPILRDTTASRMWEMVHHHLQLRKCWLIHLDEGQELGGRGSETEKAAVINALKSLMQIPDWPVNLIVSGTLELNDLLMQDPQLSRRFFVVRFLPVTEFDACDEVRGLVAGYAGLADIPLTPDLSDVEFIPRLIHAGREQFGVVVELIIGAITRALGDGKAAVGLKDFARFYAERSGDVSARNPFLVPDFRSIPTGRAALDPEPPTPSKGRGKKLHALMTFGTQLHQNSAADVVVIRHPVASNWAPRAAPIDCRNWRPGGAVTHLVA
jgi:hypothetical protein